MPRVRDDVLSALPKLKWREKEYPVTARSMSFRHETVEHGLQYRPGDFPEPIAPHGFLFRYTIPARDGVAKGGYGQMFSGRLLELVRAFRDKTVGPLVDPVYGVLDAVPISFADDLDVQRRDGVDITIELLEASLLNAAEEDTFEGGLLAATALARNTRTLDQEINLVDWEQEPSPEPSTDPFSLVEGVGRQILAQSQRVRAKMHDLAYRLERIEETADRVENPGSWKVRDGARRLRDAANQIAKRGNEPPGTKVKRITLRSQKSVMALAQELGMTPIDLIRMNPALARSPLVKAGTPIMAKAA